MKMITLLPLVILVAGCDQSASSANTGSDSVVKSTYETGSTNGTSSSASNSEPAPAPTPSPDGTIEPKFEKPKDGEEVAVINTKFGRIIYKFRADLAPKHVENFKKLAKKGFYDKTIFHRVIPDFMIQGGDPNTKDLKKVETYGQGGPGYTIPAEFNKLDHKRGVVSMARSQAPDSAGCQFFICVGNPSFLNKQYTAFGEVVEGMDVADKIVGQTRNDNDMPDERIEMTVKIQAWPIK
jgi:peptidyl-prolyl cis-trans isomerase B (cyclophilin B)